METLVEIRGLNVMFPTFDGGFRAIKDLDLDIHSGDKIAIMGESGCGKSVLGHSIMGLLADISVTTGSIMFMGKEIVGAKRSTLNSLRGSKVALVPQSPSTALDPVMKVGMQIDEMFWKVGIPKKEASERSKKKLGALGFKDPDAIYSTYPHRLSGGMCERAVIAMGTALDPELLIADEPTKGLDPAIKIETLKNLYSNCANKTLMMITHDYYAAHICNRVCIMYRGEMVEDGNWKEVLTNPSHPYVRGLWSSLPKNGMVPINDPLRVVPDGGCGFGDRCGSYSERCNGKQKMITESDGHYVRCWRAGIE